MRKIYSKFVTLRPLLKICQKIFKNVKKIEKIHMDSEKLINSFEMKRKDRSPGYLWDNFFVLAMF